MFISFDAVILWNYSVNMKENPIHITAVIWIGFYFISTKVCNTEEQSCAAPQHFLSQLGTHVINLFTCLFGTYSAHWWYHNECTIISLEYFQHVLNVNQTLVLSVTNFFLNEGKHYIYYRGIRDRVLLHIDI